MKFDLISEEIAHLKRLSDTEGMSVKEYLDFIETERASKRMEELTLKCGGDTELAEKLLKLENTTPRDFEAELKAEFPSLSAETLPEEVKTAAKLKGTGLLFEYLLYEHRQRVAATEEIHRHQKAEELSLGSHSSEPARSAVDTEFLKGIWGN